MSYPEEEEGSQYNSSQYSQYSDYYRSQVYEPTKGGLYKMYPPKDGETIFSQNVENFIKYCCQYLKPQLDESFTIPDLSPPFSQTIHHHHHYHDSWWYPIFYPTPTQTVTIVVCDKDKKDEEKKKKKKKEEEDFSLGTKLLLVGTGIVIVLGFSHYLTSDYVNFYRLCDGKNKMKKCRKTLQQVKNKNMVMHCSDHVDRLEILSDNFKQLHTHLRPYRLVNSLSKLGMGITSVVTIVGSLYYGPTFLSNSNVTFLSLSAMGSAMVYIINRTYYSRMFKESDRKLSKQIHAESVDLCAAQYPQEYQAPAY